MAIIRVEKNKNYTIMGNYHLKDKNLSLKAKGLMSIMLSLPDDWDYSINGLVAICKENETSIKSALDELKQLGYLIVNKKLPNETTTGRIEYEYILHEQKTNNKNINNIYKENIKEIIDYLNLKARKKYSYSGNDTVKHITARLNEKYTIDDFKKVIDIKCSKWLCTDMEDYLRPSTLFGTKFETYLNENIKINQQSEPQFKSETSRRLYELGF